MLPSDNDLCFVSLSLYSLKLRFKFDTFPLYILYDTITCKREKTLPSKNKYPILFYVIKVLKFGQKLLNIKYVAFYVSHFHFQCIKFQQRDFFSQFVDVDRQFVGIFNKVVNYLLTHDRFKFAEQRRDEFDEAVMHEFVK